MLQTAGRLNILQITPQRPTATVGQTGPGAAYTIKMAVRNDGQAAGNVDSAPPTTTALDFDNPAGWVTSVQPSLVGGDTILSGGET